VLFITYSDEFPLPDNGDFYMVFEGKNQRHVTTAQQINLYTLCAIVPGKNIMYAVVRCNVLTIKQLPSCSIGLMVDETLQCAHVVFLGIINVPKCGASLYAVVNLKLLTLCTKISR